MDVAREVARDLLGDPAKVEFRLLTPGGRLDALEKNQVDIVAQTMTITCQRAERVAFSTVYLEAYQRVLVTEGRGSRGLRTWQADGCAPPRTPPRSRRSGGSSRRPRSSRFPIGPIV